MKRVEAAQKQLARALAKLERAANHLEDADLVPQSQALDAAGETIETLHEILAAL